MKERLTGNDDGLPRDHDFFAVEGHELVLRLAIRFCSLRTVEESLASLPREAETLRRPANGDLPFPVPKLVCIMADHGRR